MKEKKKETNKLNNDKNKEKKKIDHQKIDHQTHVANRQAKIEAYISKIRMPNNDQFLLIDFVKNVKSNLTGDELLQRIYLEFVMKPDENKKMILEIGALSNEIWHRMEAIEILMNKSTFKWIETTQQKTFDLLKAEWTEIQKKLNYRIGEKTIIEEIKYKLHRFILDILSFRENFMNTINGTNKDVVVKEEKFDHTSEYNIKEIVRHLHWRQLANTICEHHLAILHKLCRKDKNKENRTESNEDNFLQYIWSPLSKKERKEILDELDIYYNDYLLNKCEKLIKHSIWHILTGDEKRRAFLALFGNMDGNIMKEMIDNFTLYLDDWMKMLEQTHLDGKISDTILPQHLQQIEIDQGINILGNQQINEDRISRMLFSSLRREGALKEPQKNIKKSIETLKDLIYIWNVNVRLLFNGSYALNVHTESSDIDCIVLVPDFSAAEANKSEAIDEIEGENVKGKKMQKMVSIERFFGKEDTKCNLEARNECEDKSLFCLLCREADVSFLRKIPNASIPLIEVKISQNDFDLSFVSVPEEILQDFPLEEPIELKEIDLFIGRYIVHMGKEAVENRMNKKNAMLRSLSSYRSTVKMKNLLGVHIKPMENNFRFTLLAIKHWAKKHSIYGSQFGFLNGINLALLVCKIFLLYPGASLSYLIEQFYITFITWKWPTPIYLEKSKTMLIPKLIEQVAPEIDTEDKGIKWAELHWDLKKERIVKFSMFNSATIVEQSFKQIKKMREQAAWIWPFITPGIFTQNSAFNINKSTGKIIQLELENTFQLFLKAKKITRELTFSSPAAKIGSIRQEWLNWINGDVDFQHKYPEYLAIACVSLSRQTNIAFCDFANTGIRFQIVYKMEAIEGVKYCHVTKLMQNALCPNEIEFELLNDYAEFLWEIKNQPYCSIWLVGIERENGKIDWEKAEHRKMIDRFNRSFGNAYDNKGLLPNRGKSFVGTFPIDKDDLAKWFPSLHNDRLGDNPFE